MEAQDIFRLELRPNDDERKMLEHIRKDTVLVARLKIEDAKIVISENGEKEIIVPYNDPAIDDEVRKSK